MRVSQHNSIDESFAPACAAYAGIDYEALSACAAVGSAAGDDCVRCLARPYPLSTPLPQHTFFRCLSVRACARPGTRRSSLPSTRTCTRCRVGPPRPGRARRRWSSTGKPSRRPPTSFSKCAQRRALTPLLAARRNRAVVAAPSNKRPEYS